MTHEPNTECLRRILYMHGVVSVVMHTDQKTAAVSMIPEPAVADKNAVAEELKNWCGFHFTVFDADDASQPAYQHTLRHGTRLSVSPGE